MNEIFCFQPLDVESLASRIFEQKTAVSKSHCFKGDNSALGFRSPVVLNINTLLRL